VPPAGVGHFEEEEEGKKKPASLLSFVFVCLQLNGQHNEGC
jgi:hypothetical protein